MAICLCFSLIYGASVPNSDKRPLLKGHTETFYNVTLFTQKFYKSLKLFSNLFDFHCTSTSPSSSTASFLFSHVFRTWKQIRPVQCSVVFVK